MPCWLCKIRGKVWDGDDPQCAFEHGFFSSNNWNCATMNALRDLASDLETTWRDDNGPCSIGYVPFEGDEYSGYIVMTWYKEHGQTGQAIVMHDTDTPRLLTEEVALEALRYNNYLDEVVSSYKEKSKKWRNRRGVRFYG